MSRRKKEAANLDNQPSDQMDVDAITENSKSEEAGLRDEANEYEKPTKNPVSRSREFGDSKILHIY